jgi:hypothetical protein
MPGTREGMYAGPRACSAASRPWGRHNQTRTPSHGVTLPRRPDYRRTVTRVKDACGAGQAGRAEARSLTRASRAHEQAAARERDTRGQFTMPCKPLCGRETAGEAPLDTGPPLQGCTLTRHLYLCSLPCGHSRPLTPYRRRITIRRQSGGGLCTFHGHSAVDHIADAGFCSVVLCAGTRTCSEWFVPSAASLPAVHMLAAPLNRRSSAFRREAADWDGRRNCLTPSLAVVLDPLQECR